MIELAGASMSPVHQVLKFDRIKDNHYGWMLHTPQRDYSLYATEDKDRTDWMIAIQVVLDNATMTERVSVITVYDFI